MNWKNTLVTTAIAGDVDPSLFLESARYHGIEVVPSEGQGDFISFYENKVLRFWNWAKDLRGYDHIVFCDCTDTLFASGLGELHCKFEAMKSDFVMSGEHYLYPLHQHLNAFEGNERYRFPNAGFFIATWDAFLREFPKMMACPLSPYGHHPNDQGRWIESIATGAVSITIDDQCRLAQCLAGTDGRWNVLNPDIEWAKRPRNKSTGSFPCIMHANGGEKWRLKEIWDLLRA